MNSHQGQEWQGPTGSAAFVRAVQEATAKVVTANQEGVQRAAEVVAGAIAAGNVLQAFGTGHSEAFAMEIAGRAGGLVPTNRLTLRDLVLFGGEPASILGDPMLEREPDVAHRILALAPVEPGDVFVLASNSGVNGCIVELALLAKDRDHALIAVTSMAHTMAVATKHPSGRRLADIADVVLDNGAPYGDAVLPLSGGGAVCGISSITSALLGQMVVADAVQLLLERGEVPPVYVSANVPDGLEHNSALEARYPGRLRRTA